MATVREYFDTDIKVMSIHSEWTIRNANGDILPPVLAKIAQDYNGNAKYWAFFLAKGVDFMEYAKAIFSGPETMKCVLTAEGDLVEIHSSFGTYSEKMSSTTLVFTRRVFLYLDELLSIEERQAITAIGAEHNLFVVVYDKEYAQLRSDMEKPLAFISHDSRDKDLLVRELAVEMTRLMCPVWYDEFSLKVGDSLRESIERGLKETRKCVVILSASFFSNSGWGKAEFDSIFTREIVEGKNVILPVWHNVSVEDVYRYSPRMADKVGLNSSLGVPELARRLVNVIKQTSEA